MTSPECHPGHQAQTFVISILLMSLTSLSIFPACCCSRYVSLWFRPLLKEIKQAGSRRIVLDCAPENIQVHLSLFVFISMHKYDNMKTKLFVCRVI
jgi:hypothetical protein